MRRLRLVLITAALFCVFGSGGFAAETNRPVVMPAAAFQLPQLPGLGGPSADWRQYDSFFTFVVKRFGQDLGGDLKDSLGDAFLDSRYELTSTVARVGGGNPVPELFVSSWKRLSPILNKALPSLSKQTASQYSSFISAADKLALVGGQGSQLGLMQISPDVLRGMARFVAPSATADPLAYTTNVDSGLRNLLGFGSAPALPGSSGTRQSRFDGRSYSRMLQEALAIPSWFRNEAIAAEDRKLNQWLPDPADLQAYLAQVRSLLLGVSDKLARKSKMTDEQKVIYRQIVYTAAWQESCWRQYVKKGKQLTPLASTTGDLGLMQVNRNTWRSVYDLKGLGGDIEYNGNAGGEILLYYLTRHAIKKNEDKQPGGNLARATYSAYNGGPGALGRYRAAKVAAAWKKVDEAFWEKFQIVSSGRELEVQRCYEKIP